MAERLKKDTFPTALAQPDRLVLIDFYSDGCVPCRRMSPILAELEERYPALYLGKINIAAERELIEQYGVRSAPTLIFFKNGSELVRLTGVQQRQKLEQLIAQYQ